MNYIKIDIGKKRRVNLFTKLYSTCAILKLLAGGVVLVSGFPVVLAERLVYSKVVNPFDYRTKQS